MKNLIYPVADYNIAVNSLKSLSAPFWIADIGHVWTSWQIILKIVFIVAMLIC